MTTGADIQRMVGDLARIGIVASVDHAGATCRVKLGEITSGDLPWLEVNAGATRSWNPPSVGEQVFVVSPEADLAGGLVIASLNSDAHPAPFAEPNAVGTKYADGTTITYDAAKHELVAALCAGGKARIEAPGGLKIVGDVEIDGKVTATGDITADTISLQKHKHQGVQPGGGVSGVPQA